MAKQTRSRSEAALARHARIKAGLEAQPKASKEAAESRRQKLREYHARRREGKEEARKTPGFYTKSLVQSLVEDGIDRHLVESKIEACKKEAEIWARHFPAEEREAAKAEKLEELLYDWLRHNRVRLTIKANFG